MTRHDAKRTDSEESPAKHGRYAGFNVANGYVVYDRKNESAWIQSDTTIAPAELAADDERFSGVDR